MYVAPPPPSDESQIKPDSFLPWLVVLIAGAALVLYAGSSIYADATEELPVRASFTKRGPAVDREALRPVQTGTAAFADVKPVDVQPRYLFKRGSGQMERRQLAKHALKISRSEVATRLSSGQVRVLFVRHHPIDTVRKGHGYRASIITG